MAKILLLMMGGVCKYVVCYFFEIFDIALPSSLFGLKEEFYEQLHAFLYEKKSDKLCSFEDHIRMLPIYNKIANYDNL